MSVVTVQTFATVCFVLAILHTFSVKHFQRFARKFPEGSVKNDPGNTMSKTRGVNVIQSVGIFRDFCHPLMKYIILEREEHECGEKNIDHVLMLSHRNDKSVFM